MKRVLITGANGLLGQKLVLALFPHFEVLATARQPRWYPADTLPRDDAVAYRQLDITHLQQCREVIDDFCPDVIVNAAAYTHVDACEEEKELCWQVNVKGVEHLARVARKHMSLVVQLSTDYIFDGTAGPYGETDRPRPLGYYGKAKLAAENAVRVAGIPYAIVRTNVLYGIGERVKTNFFLWVYNSLKAGQSIRVVTDQYNNPVLAEDLAEGIRLLIAQSGYGVYHMAGEDYLNRYEFARAVARVFEFDEWRVQPITTAELKQKAPRPMKGGLRIDKAKADLGYQPRSITQALKFLKSRLAES